MMAHAIPGGVRPSSRGFRELVKVEAKLALRAPVGLLLGVLVPVILLVIFSAIPGLPADQPGREGADGDPQPERRDDGVSALVPGHPANGPAHRER